MKLKPIKIFIDGNPFTVWQSPITYSEIIKLAGIDMPEEWHESTGSITLAIKSGDSITLRRNP